LQHFYRTAAFLAEGREDLESRLFRRDLNLFNQTLDVVFIDTISLYVYRDTETDWRRRGYSRDHRPDLPQWVLCVAVNASGWPIAWEIFPGNTADQEAIQKIVTALRRRFHIGQVTVVADRGMISKDTIKLLTGDDQAHFDYVLGCPMRQQKEVNEVGPGQSRTVSASSGQPGRQGGPDG
jgi:transposase